MATATAYKPVNMDDWNFWTQTSVPIHTPTHIQERGGSSHVQDYYGSGFTFNNAGVTGGTLESTTYKLNGVLQYKVAGLNHSAVTVSNYIENDNPAVLSYLFSGSDTFNGSSGNDVLNGYNGNDTLKGNKGSDRLNGGSGNDVLKGLAGADVLIGGTGADRFDFDKVSESGSSSTTRDRISDFKAGESDKIDLSTIDAKAGAAGNQAFKFIGTNAFSASGQLRFDAVNHVLLGSTDGDSTAEFSILLTGVNSMTGANFIL